MTVIRLWSRICAGRNRLAASNGFSLTDFLVSVTKVLNASSPQLSEAGVEAVIRLGRRAENSSKSSPIVSSRCCCGALIKDELVRFMQKSR
jgi:hypothetical protein